MLSPSDASFYNTPEKAPVESTTPIKSTDRVQIMYPTNGGREMTATPPAQASSEADRVQSLYPDSAPVEGTTETTAEAKARLIKPEGNPHHLPGENDLANQVYGETEAVLMPDDVDLSAYGNAEEQGEVKDHMQSFASTMGMNQQELVGLMNVANEDQVTQTYYDEGETMGLMLREFGPSAIKQVADVNLMLKSFPEIRNWMREGAGSNPAVVRAAINLVGKPRAMERLQSLKDGAL